MKRSAAIPQPPPKTSAKSKPVIHKLMMDLVARRDMGVKKYGTELRTHNGRDALMDAYQESLDLCAYLAQLIYERDGK